MNTALRQPGVRPAEGGRWPLWGIGAVLLLTSRLLYPSPSLSTQDQTVVTGKLVDILADKTTNLYFATGVSWLGIACLVVFLAGLYRRLKASEPADGLIPTVVLGGGLMTTAGLFVGYGFAALAGGSAYEQRAATTVAASTPSWTALPTSCGPGWALLQPESLWPASGAVRSHAGSAG